MPKDNELLKEKVIKEVEGLYDEIRAIAKAVYEKPETGYNEHSAASLISGFLENKGFSVRRNVAGMETAFTAEYSGAGKKPVIALLAEYDALPVIGHGCGHNLIGAAAAGAAAGLARALPGLKGRIMVIGCPAEEAGVDNAGGKVHLVDRGYFKDVDASLMFHPFPMTTVGGETSALIGLEFVFKGRAAHAAGNPWDGINALDGVIQTFNAINALRQHIRDHVRIHGIITHGGDAPNVVPEKASARFFIRSDSKDSLNELIAKVENCAKGAALSTGAELSINRFCNLYDSMKSNSVLAGVLEKNLVKMGLRIEGIKKGLGSTDFGNVTRAVPACELGLRLGNRIVPHTNEFATLSDSEEGYSVMMLGAKIMAMSAVDLFHSKELLEKALKEFRETS